MSFLAEIIINTKFKKDIIVKSSIVKADDLDTAIQEVADKAKVEAKKGIRILDIKMVIRKNK